MEALAEKEYLTQGGIEKKSSSSGSVNTVRIVSMTESSVTLSFRYDPAIVSAIKLIPSKNRSFHPEEKTWTIEDEFIPQLIENLERIGMIDCSALKEMPTGFFPLDDMDDTFFSQVPSDSFVPEQNSDQMTLFDYLKSNSPQKEVPVSPVQKEKPGWNQAPVNKQILAAKAPVLNNVKNENSAPEKNAVDLAEAHRYDFISENTKTYEDVKLRFPVNMGITPYEHQIYGAKALVSNRKYILADTMGLGKTLTAIIAAYNVDGKKLIISPASVKLGWRNEIRRFGIPDEKICVLTSKMLEEDLDENADWFIINYDILSKISKNKKHAGVWAHQFEVVIFDEAHYCKSVTSRGDPSSLRGKMGLEIALNVPNVYLLTGTPITNKTKDIFMLLRMVGSEIAKAWYPFANRYCDAHKNYFGWECDGSTNREELNYKLKGCLLRRKTENVLSLPSKIRSYLPVDVNLSEYHNILAQYLSTDSQEDGEDKNQGITLAALTAMKKAVANAKVDSTIELVNDIVENGKSVVVFSCFLDVVDKINAAFPGKCGLIIGNASAVERQKAIDDFQKGLIPIIICTIQAGGVGITLTKSDTVVFNDLDYTAANMRQAEDRIWRIGQKNNCSILYIYADKCDMDEMLSRALNTKLSNMGVVVDGKEEALVTMEDESNQQDLLKYLYGLRKKAKESKKKKKKKAAEQAETAEA